MSPLMEQNKATSLTPQISPGTIGSITLDGKTYTPEDILDNPDCEARKKFSYETKPRRVIVAASIWTNPQSEGRSLLAQLAFVCNLRKKNLITCIGLVGESTLQKHIYEIKKFVCIFKPIAKEISESWKKINRTQISSHVLQDIDKEILKLLNISAVRIKTQRPYAFELVDKLRRIFETLQYQFKSCSSPDLPMVEYILVYISRIEATINYKAFDEMLRIGNMWQRETKKLMNEYLENSNDFPILLWPHIYPLPQEDFKDSYEYAEFLKENAEIVKNFPENNLVNDIKFHDEQKKVNYLGKVAKLYQNDSSCRDAIDESIENYLKKHNPENNWQKNIGYNDKEINKRCIDYLVEECSWLAYVAENHPDILILYPGRASPAITWIFKHFHPKQEECWLPLNTSEVELGQSIYMKSRKNSDAIVKQTESFHITSRYKLNMSVSSTGDIHIAYEGDADPTEIISKCADKLIALASAKNSPPEPPEQPYWSCVIL